MLCYVMLCKQLIYINDSNLSVSVNTTSAPSAHRPKYYIGRPTGGVSLLTAAAATAVVVAVTIAAQRRGHIKERGRTQVTIITRPTTVIRLTERTTTTTADDGN